MPNHSFQFGEWDESFAGSGGTGGFSPTAGRSLSPPPVRRAMTSEGTRSRDIPRMTTTFSMEEEHGSDPHSGVIDNPDHYQREGSLSAEMSQVTMDPALGEGEEGEGQDGLDPLEQSSDTFASA